MKRIGILYDKESKKVFLLPNEVKTLCAKGIVVNIPTGLGSCLNIPDNQYTIAGAKVYGDWKEVVSNSDILLKVDAFNKNELNLMNKKIAITMANYLINVEMLYYMLTNNVTGLEWNALSDRNGFVFFPEIEEQKGTFILKSIKDALAKGLAKRKKDIVVYPKTPKLLILNATFAGVALAKLALADGFDVTISDNDVKYLSELKNSTDFKKACSLGKTKFTTMDANYDELVNAIKQYNVFVATATDPLNKTMLRITRQMGQSMPKGSLMVDASCEYGYAFHFIKKYASDDFKWISLDKFFYLAPKNMSDFFGLKASEIISKKSLDYLQLVVDKGTENSTIWKITNCENGKVVNASINTKLRLY